MLGSIAGENGATASVNVGIGTLAPQRQLHLRGPNAVFRMDRPTDTAAFFMVRTNTAGTPLKAFQVGTNASGSNVGEFTISNMGTAVSGGGIRRMTITNTGEAHFTGTVRAPNFVSTSSVQGPSFVSTSSRRFKQDIAPLADARALARQLQGVRFTWKDTGRPALGLIAEEVAAVLPEVVEHDADGQATGVNYSALVAVLVEALKDQQAEIASLQAEVARQQVKVDRLESRLADLKSTQIELAALKDEMTEQYAKVADLEARLTGFEALRARLAEIEDFLVGGKSPAALAQR